MGAIPPERVVVALSGGVDSSVAAALLHEQGHDVIGVTLHLWDAEGTHRVGRCCAPEDRDDARATCDLLGIPHYVFDERQAFQKHVVDPFIKGNLAGETPSPCVACNQQVKLGRLWEIAESLGATALATGHYVRIGRPVGDGPVALLKGRDATKDQSYFLYGVAPEVLARLRFPLGELEKDASREHARRLGLPNWNKPDSQELCFVPDGDVSGFIRDHAGDAPAGVAGPIVDDDGRILGQHGGIEGFTIGQRRGLGISADSPRYVLRVLAGEAKVVVGRDADLLRPELSAVRASWQGPEPQGSFKATVRFRHGQDPVAATVEPTVGGFRALFATPQRAVAPGQAAVLYTGDRVLGGGIIQ